MLCCVLLRLLSLLWLVLLVLVVLGGSRLLVAGCLMCALRSAVMCRCGSCRTLNDWCFGGCRGLFVTDCCVLCMRVFVECVLCLFECAYLLAVVAVCTFVREFVCLCCVFVRVCTCVRCLCVCVCVCLAVC